MANHMNAAKHKPAGKSLLGGAMIIAGTTVGAGMFSLPVVGAGMWFGYSILMLLGIWFCMLMSGLLLLETNLHFERCQLRCFKQANLRAVLADSERRFYRVRAVYFDLMPISAAVVRL